MTLLIVWLYFVSLCALGVLPIEDCFEGGCPDGVMGLFVGIIFISGLGAIVTSIAGLVAINT